MNKRLATALLHPHRQFSLIPSLTLRTLIRYPATTMDTTEDEYIAFQPSSEESDIEVDMETRSDRPSHTKTHPKVPKHFRKSNPKIYDNISVYAPPDSNLIFRCSQKRADWYLSRSLATAISPTSIHLNFSPAGQGRAGDPYYLEERENKCVICGGETSLAGATMLHVVPEQYRKWLPIRMKSHSSHDIVVACPECNAHWDREAAIVRKQIVKLFKIPLEGIGWIRDYESGSAKRAAGAIVSDWKRRWQEHDCQDKVGIEASTEAPEIDSTGLDTAKVEPAAGLSLEEVTRNKKKLAKAAKAKKACVIPQERLKILEKTVHDWWIEHHQDKGGSMQDQAKEVAGQKRDPLNETAVQDGSEPRKKLKTGDGSGSNSSWTTPAQLSRNPEGDSDEVPEPPPGYQTALNRIMLQAAMDAQALYKASDYKEHGQLVVARVMASSPEYHEDKDETEETIRSWKEAQPLEKQVEGWEDVAAFVRSWRSAFLDRAKPRHLSGEWKVEDPV